MVVRNSVRALFVCLIPLAILHALMLGAVTMGRFGSGGLGQLPTADMLIRVYLARILLDAAVFFTLHKLVRRFGLGGRGLYAGIGAAAGAMSYGSATATGFWPMTPIPGAVMAAGLLPTAFGALAGFLYIHAAGLDWSAKLPMQAAEADPEPAEIFDGPLQVRSSGGAFAIAAAMPVAFMFIAIMLLAFGPISGLQFNSMVSAAGVFTGMAFSLQMMVGVLLFTFLPMLVFVWICHGLCRSLKRTEALAYAAVGAVVAGVLVLIFSSGAFVIGAAPAAVLGAITMAVYRRLAGLEPKALPEAVLVRDPDALVGRDAAARRAHRVVRAG